MSVSLYDDLQGWEGLLCERGGRVVGRLTGPAGDTFTLEPCNNWPACHVWKQYNYSAFQDETNQPDTARHVNIYFLSHKVFFCWKETRPEEVRRISLLEEKGRRDHEEMAEFSVKFYYTNQVTRQTNIRSKTSDVISSWRARTILICLWTPSSLT